MRQPNKNIRIAIIGAGWFGCHIGYNLIKKKFKVEIFEKEKDIFQNASGNNTNRLHLGFHYPRSFQTRKMSFEGYKKFIKQYPQLSRPLKNNIYVIAKSKLNKMRSNLYEKSMLRSNLRFSKLDIKKTDLVNVDKTFNTNERAIDHKKAKIFFKKKLKNRICLNKNITSIKKINNKYKIENKIYDFVINCSYQQSFKLKNLDLTYEHCLFSLYKANKKNHKSYTIMDGPFYTLLRWNKDLFGLYSVKDSRIKTSKKFYKVNKSFKKLSKEKERRVKEKILKGFLRFYPKFKENFEFVKNLYSIRTIIKNKKDARICLVRNNDNFINIMSGKIDHIFYAYDEVLKCIKTY